MIPYTFKHSRRARQMRITVHPATRSEGGVNCDATVVLTAPHFVPLEKAEEFLRAKMDWVKEKARYWAEHPITKSRGPVRRYATYKEEARKLITERVNYLNAHHNFAFNRVAVRRGKTRWGSCSPKRNLNFNYKLLFLPPALRDYVITHELCHLRQMNHSKKFWALVGQTVPEYKHLRRELRGMRV